MNSLYLFIALLLICLNAFFVAAEFGMVKLRHSRVALLAENTGLRAKILFKIHHNMDAYLSACQLGITLASLGLGWVGEPAMARLLSPVFDALGFDPGEWLTIVSFLMAFGLLSFLHIVVGELMPKSLAIRQSERIALWTALPLYGFYILMYPAIQFLNLCSNALLRLIRVSESSEGNQYSTDELKFIIHSKHDHGDLTQHESKIIAHSLDFSKIKVSDIMRSKDELISLDLSDNKKTQLEMITTHRYSRYPVYKESEQNIIGLLHIKDLLPCSQLLSENTADFDWPNLLRPIPKVSYKLSALDLFQHFQRGLPHLALVYNAQQTLVGFITLDNVLQILFGRITDEFHKTNEAWTKQADGSFIVKGECTLYALEQSLNIVLDENEDDLEDISTLGGLILHRLGKMPEIGELIEFENFSVIVEEIYRSHIQELRIILKPKKNEGS